MPFRQCYLSGILWRGIIRGSAQAAKGFWANLRHERMAIGMTQERLSELADLNIRTLQKIEAGETNILTTTAIRLKKALGIRLDSLA